MKPVLLLIVSFAMSMAHLACELIDPSHIVPEKESTFYQKELALLKQNTGILVIVYIAADLHGKTVQDEALHFFSTWQLLHNTKDSTLLLLIAPKEMQSYIDLGYGLDDLIPERKAKEICDTKITPKLQSHKILEAVDIGIREVFSALGTSLVNDAGSTTRAIYTTYSAVIFVVTILCLVLIARFAPTRFFFLSPLIGFFAGLIQSIGLAIVLASLGLVMVIISFILRSIRWMK